MSTQVLEQMLVSVPVRLQERAYQTLDMQVGPVAMYCQWDPFCNCPNGRQTPDVMDQMFGTPARDTTLGDPGMGSRQTTLHQYMAPEPSKPAGLIDPQPFQYGYHLPETGTQFHFHGPDVDHLTYGKLMDSNRNTLFEEKNSFELAMNDFRLNKVGFKKFP